MGDMERKVRDMIRCDSEATMIAAPDNLERACLIDAGEEGVEAIVACTTVVLLGLV